MPTDEMQSFYSDFSSDNWAKRRLKFIAYITTSNVDKHVLDDEIPVQMCNYTDVYYNEKITSTLSFIKGTVTEIELEKFGLKKGQVVLTKDSESWEDIAIPAYVAEVMPKVVCGYHLAIIEPKNDELDGNFLFWLACSPELNDQFKLSANGVTRFGLSQYALKNAIVNIPPLNYQRKVSTFLDKKTTEIDALIDKKGRLFDLLAEKRTALITRAVTKGLNPDVPMKDSGIEWLGKIPAHWDVIRLRFVIQKIEQGWSPQCVNRPAEPGEWGVLKVGCVNQDTYVEDENKALPNDLEAKEQHEIKVGDILVSRANTKELLGGATLVHATQGKILLCDKLYRLHTNGKVDKTYLLRVLRSALARFQYERDATGTSGSMQNIGQDTLKDLILPVPPLHEQERIRDILDQNLCGLAQMKQKITSAIEKLQEYRSALITNAVAGQIKVD